MRNINGFLEIRDLILKYGALTAINGVSINIQRGAVVGIIGANTAGKSTIFNAISGLITPASGTIWYDGVRIDELPAYRRVQFGIVQVPERKRLFTKMTVLDNLKIGAYLQKDSRKVQSQMEIVFEHFPVLKSRIGQKAGSLSGGEQQMLSIGRAMMSEPNCILLDEPTLGLSPIVNQEIARIIIRLNEKGMTILVGEQNVHFALALSSWVYVLEKGRIVLEGIAHDLVDVERVKASFLGGE